MTSKEAVRKEESGSVPGCPAQHKARHLEGMRDCQGVRPSALYLSSQEGALLSLKSAPDFFKGALIS